MSSNVNRIWQPSVRPISTCPPDSSRMQHNYTSGHELYTKTSLFANHTEEQENLLAKNRNILNTSQAFNSSPRPFTRLESGNAAACSSHQSSCVAHSTPQNERYRQVGSDVANADQTGLQSSSVKTDQTTAKMDNSGPKLVHKQYNSPIDLYSMSNIRKTIEAHTELIAPGLKGINFMKVDTPVNKQSEVYKLVREEEERERRSVSRQSPTMPGPPERDVSLGPDSKRASRSAEQSSASGCVSATGREDTNYQSNYSSSQQTSQQSLNETKAHQQVPPSCSECGRPIIGPFARVGQRCIHSHCFNCTTCGTSLKNNGFFTINEKMYCDIHAKQVANMMKLRYDFEAKQETSESARNQETSRNQQQVRSASTVASESNQSTRISSHASPATISTMFADRSNSETSDDRREVRWAWRPVSESSSQLSSSTLKLDSYDSVQRSAQSSTEEHESTSAQVSRQPANQLRQPVVSNELRKSGFYPDGPQPGDRIPVCAHCHVQIQGPYILAGKTSWCKYCSQNHFNCSSCRRSLLDIGFIEDNSCKYYCEFCFEAYYAPACYKCNLRIKGDCLNALNKQWHPSCFVCGHCRRPFGNSSFYLEDNVPYCERDWKLLFTTKCCSCSLPIEAGDRWIEALDKSYHTNCFECSTCQLKLEGSTFYCKGGRPYCRMHAR